MANTKRQTLIAEARDLLLMEANRDKIITNWTTGYHHSNVIGRFKYNEVSRTLFVKFVGGNFYKYTNIPHSLYNRLWNARNKSNVIRNYFKNKPYEIVDEDEADSAW